METKNKFFHSASFRDPSGHVFYEGSTLRRVIYPIYFPQYQALKAHGFFQSLFTNQLLIPHEETLVSEEKIIITPNPVPFITNPYEWSFEQYKHAALHTLRLQKYALSKGFILKDASAYNVTFHQGKPIFIDTLSFDFYQEGMPWRAYKQFIEHFFGPLLLAKYHGTDCFKMMQAHIDGIPVGLVASLLPKRTKLSSMIYTNVHLLAKMEHQHQEDYKAKTKIKKLSKKGQENILESLYDYIKKMAPEKKGSEWGDYYAKTNYDEPAFVAKKELVNFWTRGLNPSKLIDMGGNDGTFARELIREIPEIIVTDIDAHAVGSNYKTVQKNKETNMLPFVADVLQPSPGIGFNNTERDSLLQRLKKYAPDVVWALALIHHLTLSGNVPFEKSAQFFAGFSRHLILEFPTREDSWVQSLLVRKREFINHFDFYNQVEFEKGYARYFEVKKKETIPGTQRILYLLIRKNHG